MAVDRKKGAGCAAETTNKHAAMPTTPPSSSLLKACPHFGARMRAPEAARTHLCPWLAAFVLRPAPRSDAPPGTRAVACSRCCYEAAASPAPAVVAGPMRRYFFAADATDEEARRGINNAQKAGRRRCRREARRGLPRSSTLRAPRRQRRTARRWRGASYGAHIALAWPLRGTSYSSHTARASCGASYGAS